MSTQFKFEVKYNDNDGFLEVHEDQLKIYTSTSNLELYYNDIKFVFLNQSNPNELIIGLNNNTNLSLYLLDSNSVNYSYMLNYINTAIIRFSPHEDSTGNTRDYQSNENISNTNNGFNQLYARFLSSISLNKMILYDLSEETFIKKDLSKLEANIKTDGEFSVFDNFISLDSEYFELNLPYNKLNGIELKDLVYKTCLLNLADGSLIYITPKETDETKLKQTCEFIQNNIKTSSLIINTQPYPQQNNQIQQQYPQPNIQQPYQQNNFQQNTSNMPQNQKSKLVVLILHIIFPGLGYAYMGRWGKFLITPIAMFITVVLRNLFDGTLNYMLYNDPSAPGIWVAQDIIVGLSILLLIIWIYALYNSITMVDKYNKGQPY